jgi:prepilin-type N-terminal cleavage/methylation domain-containing protein
MVREATRDVRRSERGFSLLEFLAVTVISVLLMAALVPVVSERIQMAKIRAVVSQYSLDLRAARWTAVTRRSTVDLAVNVDPDNGYTYTDIRGNPRPIELPDGLRITSSTTPIQFRPNGSVVGGATTVIEADLANGITSRWTISVSSLGVPKAIQERVES